MTAVAPPNASPAIGRPHEFSVAAEKFDAAARELNLMQDIPQDYPGKALAATKAAYDGVAALEAFVDATPDASAVGKAALEATRSAAQGAELLHNGLGPDVNISNLFYGASEKFRAAASALRP